MTTNNQEEIRAGLAKLSKQEREVLRLRCQSFAYKDIGEKLYISTSSVKQYMSRVYIKLGLDLLERTERTRALFQDVCPLLATLEGTEAPPESEEPEVIPVDVIDMVEEDERAIVVWQPPPIQETDQESTPSRGPRPLRWILSGAILSCIGLALILFLVNRFLGPFFPGQPAAPSIPDSAFTEAVLSLTQTAVANGENIPAEILPTQTEKTEPTIPTPTDTIPPTFTNTPQPTSTPTLSMQMPFTDNFDNGASPSWQPASSSGVWRVINGKYTYTGEEEFSWIYNLVGDKNWQNYIVEVDYSLENDIYAYLAVIVRAQGPGNLGLAFIISDGSPLWAIWQSDGWHVLVESENSSYEPNHIRVEVNGSRFYGVVSGVGELEIFDSSITNGMVGIAVKCRSESACPEFDNFSVASYNP